MTTTITAYLIVALIAGVFAGALTFIAMYRPYRPSWHGPAGRHLLYMSYCLAALSGASLFNRLFPLPPDVRAAVLLVILVGLCAVTWQRVYLLVHERRARVRERLNRE